MTTSGVREAAMQRPGQAIVDASGVGPASSLTPRQREALYLAAMGLTYQQAADAMTISLQSYKNHVQSAYVRLGVHRLVEAMHVLGVVRL